MAGESSHHGAAVAARIRAARAALGLSQRALGAAAGVSVPALNLIERQKSSPRLSTVEALEDALREHGVEFASDREGNQVITLRWELVDALDERHMQGETVTPRGNVGGRPASAA